MNKWLVLVAGFFLGFGTIGLVRFEEENPGGRVPAYVALGLGAVLLIVLLAGKKQVGIYRSRLCMGGCKPRRNVPA